MAEITQIRSLIPSNSRHQAGRSRQGVEGKWGVSAAPWP